MRIIVSFFALVAMVMPCMSQQLNYSVSGTYTDEGKMVYLIDYLTDNAIDSMVVADGKILVFRLCCEGCIVDSESGELEMDDRFFQ